MTASYLMDQDVAVSGDQKPRSGVFARGAESTGWGLVVLDLATERRVVPLQDGAVVGLESTSARVEGPEVAAQHARILVREDGVYIEDLDSAGGTWVQGVRVRRAQLSHGDLVRLGGLLTMFIERGLDDHRGEVTSMADLVHGPAQRAWLEPLVDRVTKGQSVCLEGPSGAGKRAVAHAAASLRDQDDGGIVVVHPGTDFPSNTSGRTWLVLDVDRIERTKQHHVAAQVRQRRDACVIATVSRPLEQAVRDGAVTPSFRALFSGKAIAVPSFDDRVEDLPLILAAHAERAGIERERLSPAFVERVVLAGWSGGLSRIEALLAEIRTHDGALEQAPPTQALPRRGLRKPLALSNLDPDLLRARLLDALTRADGSVAVAARALGVTRQNVYREAHRLGLPLTARLVRPS
jgi:hypothetical protein